jgi:hypothetical protein
VPDIFKDLGVFKLEEEILPEKLLLAAIGEILHLVEVNDASGEGPRLPRSLIKLRLVVPNHLRLPVELPMINVEGVLATGLVGWVHLLPVAHCKVEYWVLELGIMQILHLPVQVCGLVQVHDLFLQGVHLVEIQVSK